MQAISWNTGWQFRREGASEWEDVTLPHDAMLHTDRNPEQTNYFLLAGYEGDTYHYRKTFFVPTEDEGKTLLLYFEGVYCCAAVAVNGVVLKEKCYGFNPFHVELSHCLRWGEENVVEVTAAVPKEGHNRWYTGGGIGHPVWLYTGRPDHIDLYGVTVTTLSIDPPAVRVNTTICGSGQVRVSILDGDRVLTQGNGNEVSFTLPGAELWSAERPKLYTARVTLEQDGAVVDEAEETFGIRTVAVEPGRGLLVNGVSTFLRGGCIHNDNGVIGVVNNGATELHRAKAIKAAGFNAIRSAHHPMSRSLLKACDQVGLYVMNEAFDSWYRIKTRGNPYTPRFMELFREDVEDMVRESYNHPSVLIYSIGNEIPEAGGMKGVRVGKAIVDTIHGIDTTRLTTLCPSAHWLREYLEGTTYLTQDEDEWIGGDPQRAKEDFMHYAGIFMGAANNPPPEDEKDMPYPPTYQRQDEDATKNLYPYLDIAGYNYYEDKYETLHQLHPERVLLGTETRGDRIADTMRFAARHPYLIGDFIWTLQDHLGEVNTSGLRYGDGAAGRGYPWLVNFGGVLDLIGTPLPELHRFRILWGQEKGLFLSAQPPIYDGQAPVYNCYKWTDSVEGWTFEGCEGEKTLIDVHTDAAQVEVFVNGASLGRKTVTDCFVRFPCVYQPGEVSAIAYDSDGQELYRAVLRTAGAETRLESAADRTALRSGGEDFAFINLRVTDGQGIPKLLPERRVSLEIEGGCTLQGFGSANPRNTEKFSKAKQSTYFGRLRAVVRSSPEPGSSRIIFHCEGAPDTVVTLTCE